MSLVISLFPSNEISYLLLLVVFFLLLVLLLSFVVVLFVGAVVVLFAISCCSIDSFVLVVFGTSFKTSVFLLSFYLAAVDLIVQQHSKVQKRGRTKTGVFVATPVS